MKILLVSIAFPPKSDPESIQVGRYIRQFVRSNHEVIVLTSANPTLYMETDSHLQQYAKGIRELQEIKIIEYRIVNYLLRKLFPVLLEYPDSKFSFYLSNAKVEKPDIIYSRSYPLSSTLLALKLKLKWPNVPWILHLSDPWAISFKGNSPATNFRKRSRKWNRRKEHECFKKADAISFTTDKTAKLYQDEYPNLSDKFFISPNVYDDNLINPRPVKFNKNLMIVYTGGFGDKRDPSFFLSGIKAFLDKYVDIREFFRFIFTGPMTKKNQHIFFEYRDVPEIEHLGTIEFNKMLSLQRKAHVLVNIDSDIDDPDHSVFMPSKLLEYFCAKRRILAITNKHSYTYKLIQSQNGDCLEFGDFYFLEKLLMVYFNKFNELDAEYFTSNKNIHKYGAYYNSQLLLKKMNEISL